MLKPKRKARYYSDAEKLEVATYHIENGRSTKETLFRYKRLGMTAANVCLWVKKYEPIIKGVSQEDALVRQAKEAAIIVKANRDLATIGVYEVQDLAIKRIKALIETEEDLNKVARIFEITLKVTNPEINTDGNPIDTKNFVLQINNQIVHGTSKA